MENINEIHDFIDNIPIKSKSIGHERRKLRSRKLWGIPLGLWTIFICSGFVFGALLGGGYLNHSFTQSMTIETDGLEGCVVYFDDVAVKTQTWTVPADIFTDDVLENGEVEIFEHTIRSNAIGGNWTASWDIATDMPFITDEPHMWYGYSFSVLDSDDNEITEINIIQGEQNKTLKFEHSMHSDFQQPSEAIEFIFNISLDPPGHYDFVLPSNIWHFNEGYGDTTCDSEGNENMRLPVGEVWDSENMILGGSCLSNTTALASRNCSNFTVNDSFSYNVWVNINNLNTHQATITKYDGDKGIIVWIQNDFLLRLQMDGTDGSLYLTSTNTVPEDVWSMLTVTYDGSGTSDGVCLYIDGNEETKIVTSDTVCGDMQNTVCFSVQNLFGLLDELVIWPGVIDQAKVTKLWNHGEGVETI